MTVIPDAAAAPEDVVVRVLDVVRQLARETGGARAERAVAASASLEREVGLGSLERVELLARLERAFGRPLDDGCLAVDTPAGLARAILDAAPSEPLQRPRAGAGGRGPRSCAATPSRPSHESLWRRAELEPERVHVFLRGDPAGAEQAISYGCLRDEAAAVAGGLHERRGRAGRHGRADAADRTRLPAFVLRRSCWCARCRCRSTRRCGSTGSRSTRRASPRSWPTPASRCWSRSRAHGRSQHC